MRQAALRISLATLFLAASHFGASEAADVVVGGSGGWNNDMKYTTIDAKTGDVLVGAPAAAAADLYVAHSPRSPHDAIHGMEA